MGHLSCYKELLKIARLPLALFYAGSRTSDSWINASWAGFLSDAGPSGLINQRRCFQLTAASTGTPAHFQHGGVSASVPAPATTGNIRDEAHRGHGSQTAAVGIRQQSQSGDDTKQVARKAYNHYRTR